MGIKGKAKGAKQEEKKQGFLIAAPASIKAPIACPSPLDVFNFAFA
jgi:hypothetical protein